MHASTSDEIIFSKVNDILNHLHQNQKLQKLAEDNGLDVKNAAKLTDDTVNNVAVTVVALLLAQRDGDPRYKKLVNTGLQKRSLKTELVNDYKNQANMLIQKCQNEDNIDSHYDMIPEDE